MHIKEKQCFTHVDLANHLREKDGHLGREGKEALALAKHMGRSIHSIQSIALGRRNFSDRDWAKVARWVARRG
jgi:hypothetical protein